MHACGGWTACDGSLFCYACWRCWQQRRQTQRNHETQHSWHSKASSSSDSTDVTRYTHKSIGFWEHGPVLRLEKQYRQTKRQRSWRSWNPEGKQWKIKVKPRRAIFLPKCLLPDISQGTPDSSCLLSWGRYRPAALQWVASKAQVPVEAGKRATVLFFARACWRFWEDKRESSCSRDTLHYGSITTSITASSDTPQLAPRSASAWGPRSLSRNSFGQKYNACCNSPEWTTAWRNYNRCSCVRKLGRVAGLGEIA